MKINLLTACPEYFASILETSILGRAIREGKVRVEILSLRDFADGKTKKQVDDTPYGGGAGMILKVEPIYRALQFLKQKNELGHTLLTCARGPIFTQNQARQLSRLTHLTLICGHYEGVDERVRHFIDGQISLGQFVLTGGEPAAAVIIDATVRLLDGVLGNQASLSEESFDPATNALEYPQYTRPEDFRGHKVPVVLLSGHHGEIKKWRDGQRKAPIVPHVISSK